MPAKSLEARRARAGIPLNLYADNVGLELHYLHPQPRLQFGQSSLKERDLVAREHLGGEA